MSLSPEVLVDILNGLMPEFLWLLMLMVCFAVILFLLWLFGEVGLQMYVVVAIIVANIQVLKLVKFSVYSEPVALGTILFSTTYLCTDILLENYGRAAAKRAVMLGFVAYLFSTVLMMFTLGFKPLSPDQAGDELLWALSFHNHMSALFTPAPALFAAGMTAYLLSQFHDIWLYHLLQKWTGKRWLWLRNNVSTMCSSLIDNVIFSILAWMVFAADPMLWHTVIFTFILGTYWLRLLIAAMDTPIIYVSRLICPSAVRVV